MFVASKPQNVDVTNLRRFTVHVHVHVLHVHHHSNMYLKVSKNKPPSKISHTPDFQILFQIFADLKSIKM